jgi:hypothetical protein
MAFTHVFADSGSIYATTGGGSLLWYRDDLRDGTNGPNAQRGWAANSGHQVGLGWTGFRKIVAGGDGIIYAIRQSGELHWYRDDLRDGSNGASAERGWAANSGRQIGTGWNGFRHVFSGGEGILYAIRETGELLWYRDDLRDGSNGASGERGWAASSGQQIGTGWTGFRHVFSGGSGAIYAIRETGELLWYRDDLRDGSNGAGAERGWGPNSGAQIGVAWNFPAVLSPGAGDGLIYAITDTADLLWYRDDLRDGTNGAGAERGWAANSGNQIGLGWNIQPESQLEGYVVPLSIAAGGGVEVKVSSSTTGTATLQLLRLTEQRDGSVGAPVGGPMTIEVGSQPIPPLAWQEGCAWSTTASLDVGADLSSGLYGVRITLNDSTTTDIVFVVRRAAAARPAPLLVLANTNCWNAYNAWGGRSNYTDANTGITLSFERPNPETVPDVRTADGFASNHLTAAEIWMLSWLERQGYKYEVCSDADLHNSVVNLSDYKAIILSTHPEYWSQVMARAVQDYLGRGGCMLYLGGNGAFRTVEYSDDATAMTTGADPDHWCAQAWKPEGPLPRSFLGVAYDVTADGNYPSRCGYVVDNAGHRFFAGTGLSNGDICATTGRNGGGACGWEVDCAAPEFVGGPSAPGVEVLGHGQLVTAAGYRGDISYYNTVGGGFVFAIGSITVTGALDADTRLATLVNNAISAAVAR